MPHVINGILGRSLPLQNTLIELPTPGRQGKGAPRQPVTCRLREPSRPTEHSAAC